MRKMKDSGIEWIGEIPNDWRVYKVKNICRIRGEKNRPQAQVLSVYRELGVVVKAERNDNHNVTSEDTSSYKYVLPNDLVVNKMKAWQGSMGISRFEGIVSPAYYVFKIISDEIYPMYIHYLLRNVAYLPEYRRLSGGIRPGQWDLSIENLQNIPILIPPYDNQCRIVSYLERKCSQIDDIIARQQEVIEKLKAYKLSVITEAVTKGLNPDARMKDSGVEWIGEIPEHWSIVPLTKQLESIVDYRGKTPEKVDDGIFLVTARNIKNGMIDYSISSEYVKAEDYDEIMRRGIPQIGDVLFTTEAPLGQVANVDRTDIALAQRIIKFSTKKHLDSYFLKYWIMSIGFQNFLMTLSTGSTAVGIKASKLFMLPVPLAPMQEQNQIVTYLDKKCKMIESVIDRKQALVDKFTDYKKSLIYEVVTGKKEV